MWHELTGLDPACGAPVMPRTTITPPMRCPTCNYNVDHIESTTCPECGTSLDRAALARDGSPPWRFLVALVLNALAFIGNVIAIGVAVGTNGALWRGAIDVFAVNLFVSGGAAAFAASLAVDAISDRRVPNRRAWLVLCAAIVAGLWAVWRLGYPVLFWITS